MPLRTRHLARGVMRISALTPPVLGMCLQKAFSRDDRVKERKISFWEQNSLFLLMIGIAIEETSPSRRIRCRFCSAMARSVVRGINAMAGSESGVAGHAMATLRGAAPAMTHQALAASTSSCPPGSKIRNAHLMWMDEVKMKLRRRARFRWEKSPKTVLFVKKVGDREVSARSREMAEWLLRRGLQVYVEPEAKATGDFPGDCEPWTPQDDTVSLVERRARRDHRTESNRTPLSLCLSIYLSMRFAVARRSTSTSGWSPEGTAPCCTLQTSWARTSTTGPAGTTSGLYPPACPSGEFLPSLIPNKESEQGLTRPSIALVFVFPSTAAGRRMGSLGFMTSFQSEQFERVLDQVVGAREEGREIYTTLRTRLSCMKKTKDGRLRPAFSCLNECVIDKGLHPGLGKIELAVDGQAVTTVQVRQSQRKHHLDLICLSLSPRPPPH